MELGEVADDPGQIGFIDPDVGGERVKFAPTALNPPGIRLVRGSRVRFERHEIHTDWAKIVGRSDAKKRLAGGMAT